MNINAILFLKIKTFNVTFFTSLHGLVIHGFVIRATFPERNLRGQRRIVVIIASNIIILYVLFSLVSKQTLD